MDDNEYLNEEEKLKAENDFLKMKLMLEHGADFYAPEENRGELPPDVENDFLNHIDEWERQFAERKMTTVYERIGKPQHFTPASEIPDAEMEEKWRGLSQYMAQFGIDLTACSPNVTARELYRFTMEELFQHEMQDIFIPGMMSSFIYDEFHPDDEYDNTRYAVDDCIRPILCKEPLTFAVWYAKDGISVNEHTGLTEEKLKELVNAFKAGHDDIELQEIGDVVCNLKEEICTVTGTHETLLDFGDAHANATGKWTVVFACRNGFWNIVKVEIENVGL